MRMGGYYGRGGGGMDWQAGSGYYGSSSPLTDVAGGLARNKALNTIYGKINTGMNQLGSTVMPSTQISPLEDTAGNSIYKPLLDSLQQSSMQEQQMQLEREKMRMQAELANRGLMDDLIKQRYAYRLQYGE